MGGKRKRVAQALSDSEAHRLVIDTIPTAAWAALPDGSNAFVNRRWSEYTGLRGEDSTGRGWQSVLHPDDVEKHIERWRVSLATGQPFENEARLRRAADGAYRWFLIRGAPLHDESGNVVRWYGTATDVEDLKRAEYALRRSEAYLGDAQRMSHTGSWAFDLTNRRVLHSSEEHHRLFGFDPAGAMPHWDDWIRRLHPDDRQRTIETIEQSVREQADLQFDCRIVHPDGTFRYIHAFGHPVFGAPGDPVICVGTSIDVTERRLADEALRDSEERWKAAFENNPTMYFMVDTDGIVVSVNSFGAGQLGYTVDELNGGSVLKVFYPADRAAAQRELNICIRQPSLAMSWELRMVRRDGSVLWVRETARAMLLKDKPVILIACEDVTDRKDAESLTTQVFESAPDGICIVGRDYRYRRCNPVYTKAWGSPARPIVGMHVSEALGADAFNRTLKPHLDRCFAGEQVAFEWWSEFRGPRYLAVSYSPLRSGQGEVEAVLVIQRDLTAYMRASEALREAQAQLAHVNRVATMGQLTASIAHEVNQPIAATIANAQAALRWLAHRPPNLGEVRQSLEDIVSSGNRAGDVVARIRALVKNAPPQNDRLDINEAIREVVALTRSEAGKNSVALQLQFAERLPLIEGDRVQLQQVMLNLIINAIEATSAIDEGARELLISTGRAEAGGVFVAVRDSGPGLNPQDLEHVFDAFYTTKSGGMGMGLAICRSIIEAHGGHVWATPNTPRGATFQFNVPARLPASLAG